MILMAMATSMTGYAAAITDIRKEQDVEIRFLKDVTINDEAFKAGDSVETDAHASLDADTVAFLTEQEAVEAAQAPPPAPPTEQEADA